MTEIDWSKVPEKYNWAAINSFGDVCAFENKPKVVCSMWLAEGEQIMLKDNIPDPMEDWRQSIRERPEAAQEFPKHEVNDTYKVFVKHLEDVSKQISEMQQELIQKAIEMVSLESVEKSILKSENRDLRETLAELREKIQGLVSHD